MEYPVRSVKGEEPVVVVVPPVVNPNIPTLGASVLAATCRREGIPARVHYASVAYAGRLGFDLCERLASGPPRQMLAEAIFMAAAFPNRRHSHPRVLRLLSQIQDPLRQAVTRPALTDGEIARCAADAPEFVAETAKCLLQGSPRVVGISSMCQQVLSSIAIARELKRVRPGLVTVLGGANAAEPMGRAILDLTDAFDFVFSGEADEAFPRFCRAYLNNGTLPDRRVISCEQVDNLDSVASPDYDDYFEEIEPHRLRDDFARHAPYWLIFESSRGCWWSEKLGCTFCGFNTPGGRYRAKSPQRLLHEVNDLIARYGVHEFYASDTIMAQDFPKTVLSHLYQHVANIRLSYEVKSNVKAEDLDTFVRAGVVEIQPGIESLSDHVLRLMCKGVTALENIRLLRDARSRGIEIIWNFLTAIPNETAEDYEKMLEVIPLLEHLRPPTRWGPIRISRYSPYQRDPARYGIRGLTPWQAYVELFGNEADRIAQHFSGDYDTEFTRDTELQNRFYAVLREWATEWLTSVRPPTLHGRSQADGSMIIYDTRSAALAGTYTLSPALVTSLEMASEPINSNRLSGTERTALESLTAIGLVIRSSEHFLSVVTEPEIGEHLWRERMQSRASADNQESNGHAQVVGER